MRETDEYKKCKGNYPNECDNWTYNYVHCDECRQKLLDSLGSDWQPPGQLPFENVSTLL